MRNPEYEALFKEIAIEGRPPVAGMETME